MIRQITVATTNTEAMARFYNAVLSCELSPFPAYGTTLYRGKLGAIELLFCPNEIAGVVAEQSRHQFNFEVADLDSALRAAADSDGSVDEVRRDDAAVAAGTAGSGKPTSASLRDPDGNTLEILQAVFETRS